ncbi:SPOR domain-containing protein [Alistipes putredinis]|nr:SPOR domain-containing protein [Alistipes putredinis]
MMWHKLLIGLFLTFSVVIVRGASDPAGPGIPALQSNSEYVALRDQDSRLQVRIDEMQTRIAGLRAMLRENPAAQETYGAQILSLESEMLSAQGLRTQVAARINAIEQAWLTEHPDYVPAAETEKSLITQTPESQQSRNLVFNGYFRENLPARDYEALLRAQRMEAEVAGCAGRLLENYRQQTLLKQQYDTVRTEQAAVDLFGRYRTVANLGRVLRDSLTAVWGYVYDNKSYAYDYILDKLNCRDQQARQQKALDDVRRQMSAAQAEGLVDALPDYYIRKCYLTDYEREIARLLGLGLASDSLKRVALQLQTIDFRLPKPEITERYFLDYEPVQFVAGRYTYKKPIPDCPVYEHGVIYRILLGEYKYKQNISIFRSASPLYVLKTDAGRYRYFAGGFATKAEAVDAQELLRAKGFRRPELVVWYDGEYTNLTRTPEAEMAAFRVEISSEQNLSDTVKQAIAQAAPGCDLSRVGADLFVVGQFDNKAVADQAAAAIRAADPQLSVKVTEIAK